uniref:Eukaryotic peptide chain release factor gtp-binding subunit erf3a n=1 Tax=Triatoma infestans TaxID=30076 RepID=A0A171A9N0_TRIIF
MSHPCSSFIHHLNI